MKKQILLTTAATIAATSLAVIPAAAAQEEGAQPQSRDVITVTARRREETIQTVPVAVTAFSAQDLIDNNVRNLEELALLTPGLQLQSEFGRGGDRPVIRGQANILGDSGVAYFIDGAYITGSLQSFDLRDIERVEVIRGPQSALYGRNTYSGAIAYYTRQPSNETEAYLEGSIGEDGFREGRASLSGALVDDVLWGSLSLRSYDYDGAFTNANGGGRVGDQSSRSVSGRLRWQASPSVLFDLRAAWSEDEDGQPAQFATSADDNNCFFDNGGLYGGNGRYFCGTIEPGDIALNTDDGLQFVTPPGRDMERTQFILNTEIDLGQGVTFRSLTSYTEEDGRFASDSDFTATPFPVGTFTYNGIPLGPTLRGFVMGATDFSFEEETRRRDFSQEFRIGNDASNAFSWQAGLFYFSNRLRSEGVRERPAGAAASVAAAQAAELARIQARMPPGVTAISLTGPASLAPVANRTSITTIENLAAFALADYDLTDRLTLSLEGRYQSETQTLDSAATGGRVSADFNSFTPRVTLSYQLSDATLLYGSYSEGTKPGGFNSVVFTNLADAEVQAASGATQALRDAATLYIAVNDGRRTFDEEEVRAFEIGAKNTLMDGQLLFNVAAFFNQVEGYQLTGTIPNLAQSGVVSITENAGDADIRGVELDIRWSPAAVPGLSFGLGYAWTDSEFVSGSDQQQGLLLDVADNGLPNCSLGLQIPGVPCGNGANALRGSIIGNRIPRSSEHQVSASAGYTAQLAGDWIWYARGILSYESERYVQVHNLADTGPATVVNLNFGIENDQYSIRLWGKNVFDEDAALAVVRYADAAAGFRRNFFGTRRDPAQWGLTVSARF